MNLIRVFLLTTALVATGCITHQYPQRALIEPKIIHSSIALEKQLNQRESVPIPQGKNWFEVIEGRAPVIITAPHSTRPFREGKRRFSDGGGTAALAVALAELTGATVIYTTYEGPSDPNYYDNNEFKTELARLINQSKPLFLLDIHGSHAYRSFDLDIGTMQGASLLGNDAILFSLIDHLKFEGIDSLSYNRFQASKNETIVKFASKHRVPAIQLEVNITYISPFQGNLEAQRYSKLLQGLTRFILTSLEK
jgi:hypothetical protein